MHVQFAGDLGAPESHYQYVGERWERLHVPHWGVGEGEGEEEAVGEKRERERDTGGGCFFFWRLPGSVAGFPWRLVFGDEGLLEGGCGNADMS